MLRKRVESQLITTLKIFFLILLATSFGSLTGRSEVEVGAFLGTNTPTAQDVKNFEQKISHHVASVLVYTGMYPGAVGTVPPSVMHAILYHEGYDTGTSLHVTFEPWVGLQDISSGKYDYNLEGLAESLKAYPAEVRFRFAHEMIHDDDPRTEGWYPWQDRPEEYKKAYIHLYSIFKSAGADNVKFVWAPNQHISDFETISKYYPGKEYVDWIGMDGYGFPGTTFDDVFEALYQTIVNHPEFFGDKDIMLAEFATAEGDYKAQWIQEAFNAIKEKYKKIKAFYWFDVDKERDWRVDSSEEAREAFVEAMKDPIFVGHRLDSGSGTEDTEPQDDTEIVKTKTINVRVSVPRTVQLRVGVNQVNSDGSWSPVGEVDFGTLSFDPQYKVFRSGVYFAVDVGIVCNTGGWKLIHQPESIIGPNGSTLDENINVTFVIMSADGRREEVREKVVYGRSEREFSPRDIPFQWLRIYYGLASGVDDAPGAKPITIEKAAGTYTGRVVLTLVVD